MAHDTLVKLIDSLPQGTNILFADTNHLDAEIRDVFRDQEVTHALQRKGISVFTAEVPRAFNHLIGSTKEGNDTAFHAIYYAHHKENKAKNTHYNASARGMLTQLDKDFDLIFSDTNLQDAPKKAREDILSQVNIYANPECVAQTAPLYEKTLTEDEKTARSAFLQERVSTDLNTAIGKEAIDHSRRYPLSHSGISGMYGVLHFLGDNDLNEQIAKDKPITVIALFASKDKKPPFDISGVDIPHHSYFIEQDAVVQNNTPEAKHAFIKQFEAPQTSQLPLEECLKQLPSDLKTRLQNQITLAQTPPVVLPPAPSPRHTTAEDTPPPPAQR